METALSTEELGRDLTSVQNLLKKHQLLEAEIAGHASVVESIKKQAQECIAAGNFKSEAIKSKQEALSERYANLQGPKQTRRQALEDSAKLQQFLRTVDDELSWINEKMPSASSTNYGTSLVGVQNLQKKHSALKAEIEGRIKVRHGLLCI